MRSRRRDGIGITTVVALTVIAGSPKATTEDIVTAGGSEFPVGQKGSADLTSSTVAGKD